MTNYSVKTVDEFIDAAALEARAHLEEIRSAVKSALPDAEEKIGYGKPGYKHFGWVAFFDTYTHHIGLEVWDGLSDDDRKQLEEKGYKTGSKTFQIRYDQEVPVAFIRKLVKNQAELNEVKKK